MQLDHYKISFSNTVEYHLLLLCWRFFHLYPVLILPNLWTAFDAFGRSGFPLHAGSLFCLHHQLLLSFLTLNVGWLPNSILGFFPFLTTLTPLVISCSLTALETIHILMTVGWISCACAAPLNCRPIYAAAYMISFLDSSGHPKVDTLKLSFCTSHSSRLLDFLLLVVQTEEFWSLAWL